MKLIVAQFHVVTLLCNYQTRSVMIRITTMKRSGISIKANIRQFIDIKKSTIYIYIYIYINE